MADIDKSQLITRVGKVHHGADGLATEWIIPMTIGEGLGTGEQFELRITEDAARELYSVLKERLGL
jgi:hypothetical protein